MIKKKSKEAFIAFKEALKFRFVSLPFSKLFAAPKPLDLIYLIVFSNSTW
jgi:hypothetical protein